MPSAQYRTVFVAVACIPLLRAIPALGQKSGSASEQDSAQAESMIQSWKEKPPKARAR